MKRTLFILALAFLCFSASAEVWSGEGTCMEVVPSASVSLGTQGMNIQASLLFRLKWKVWTLMGEPVVDSAVAWTISDVWIKDAAFLKVKTGLPVRVPKEIAAKIRLIDVRFLGKASPWVHSPILRIDPGVLSAPYLSGYDYVDKERDGVLLNDGLFSRLAPKEKERWFGFNVPGSPEWGKLFWEESGAAMWMISRAYSPAEAKDFMKRGISLNYFMLESAMLDLSAVRDWLQESERKEIAALKAATDKKATEIAAKEEKRKNAESEDFWGTPAKTLTTEDEREEAEIRKNRTAIGDAETVLAFEAEKTKALRLEFDEKLSARIAELKSLPKPGEGVKGEYVRDVVLPEGYEYVGLPNGSRTVLLSDSGEIQVFDLAKGQLESVKTMVHELRAKTKEFPLRKSVSGFMLSGGNTFYLYGEYYYDYNREHGLKLRGDYLKSIKRIFFDMRIGKKIDSEKYSGGGIFSPDGKTIMEASDHHVKLFDIETDDWRTEEKSIFHDNIFYSPDSKYIISFFNYDKTVSVYRDADLKLLFSRKVSPWSDFRFAVPPGSDRLVVFGRDSTRFSGIIILSIPDLQEVGIIPVNWSIPMEGAKDPELRVLGDGRRILIQQPGTFELIVYDISAMKELLRLSDKGDSSFSKMVTIGASSGGRQLSKDDRYIALSDGTVIKIWNLDTGALVKKLDGKTKDFVCWLDDSRSFILKDKQTGTLQIYR